MGRECNMTSYYTCFYEISTSSAEQNHWSQVHTKHFQNFEHTFKFRIQPFAFGELMQFESRGMDVSTDSGLEEEKNDWIQYLLQIQKNSYIRLLQINSNHKMLQRFDQVYCGKVYKWHCQVPQCKEITHRNLLPIWT